MFPNRITIQWHLTKVCNCRCKHCYQDDYQDEGEDLAGMMAYFIKIKDFISQLSNKNHSFKAHINFTGGEPFLKENFLDLLEELRKTKSFSFGILSNGLLLSDEELVRLKKMSPGYIQISLEGNQAVNDAIRGSGSFGAAIEAIKKYKNIGIPVIISFTANSFNYQYYPEVVKIARKYNVNNVWTDRYLPRNSEDKLALNNIQVKELFHLIQKEKKRSRFYLLSKTKISSSRALQFLVCGGKPYRCPAGYTLLTILQNGDVLPCRRLPIKIGNLKEDNLFNLYQNNVILSDLRSGSKLDIACCSCYYQKSCNGGLKCLSYSFSGDYNKKDPNCWLR